MTTTTSTPSCRRILFLDAYDSFANNITALLATLLDADVHVLPIDAALDAAAFRAEAACYDAVVCGPGPGSPDCAADIGLMAHVWSSTFSVSVVPALGICLGFQSLVTAHGGRIRRLKSGGLHGMVRAVDSCQHDVFADVPPFRATLYHSLGADVGQDAFSATQWPAARWDTLAGTPLQPLAWVEEPLTLSPTAPTTNERILMGVRHATLPFWGLQYHPESVCTDAASHAVLVNWFRAAVAWNRDNGRVRAEPTRRLRARQATRPSLLSQSLTSTTTGSNSTFKTTGSDSTMKMTASASDGTSYAHSTITLPPHIQVPDIVEMLHDAAHGAEPEHIIFDSASAARCGGAPSDPSLNVGDASDADAIRGRYSIIALDVGAAVRYEYRAGDCVATIRQQARVETVELREQSIWQLLAAYHASQQRAGMYSQKFQERQGEPESVPFRGGFMGYVTYEQGLSDIGVAVPDPKGRSHTRPDICWAWVTRSIVVDHARGLVHVQSIADSDAAWVESTVDRLQAAAGWALAAPASDDFLSARPRVVGTRFPDAQRYEDLVRQCQEHISAGESYELCLTGETQITTTMSDAGQSAAWALYRALRTANPTPFASYVRLGAATLVSSSPERFLCFSRGSLSKSLVCSMRPMKGTVRRSSTVRTLADAETLLHVPKEEAENLMIVDLVRHDLHAVCGPGGVHVPRLLQVEPYGHVFQMVSVVEGTSSSADVSGIDVLAASLPPGSMTGAPKKRSCALLTGLEAEAGSRNERSLYAGVVGYVCVTGRGDWSVTIRSLFRWDDETVADNDAATHVWHMGAGGAVTILSTPKGEREEMFTKLAGPLGVFDL